MSKPLVSVITVVFNGAATLADTISSVAAQTFRDLEFIIIGIVLIMAAIIANAIAYKKSSKNEN